MIRYGVNPIGRIDDDVSPGDHIPLEQCLREAAETGFEGIEPKAPEFAVAATRSAREHRTVRMQRSGPGHGPSGAS